MDYSSENQSEAVITEKTSLTSYVLLILGGLVLIALIILFVMNQETLTNNTSSQIDQTDDTSLVSEDFLTATENVDAELKSGNTQTALDLANELVANSTTDQERGRANLTLGLVERTIDPTEAVVIFKNVSLEEDFHPVTRAFAIWYTLERYFGDRDTDFAAQHIFTGPVWKEYVTDGYSDNPDLQYRLAAIQALRSSLDLNITAQVAMRLASEQASLLRFDELTNDFKTESAAQVTQYITLGDSELTGIESLSNHYYTGTEYLVLAAARNSKALALDTLFSEGYITDEAVVIDAYEEALAAVIDYNIESTHKYFIRYNYADFLARHSFAEKRTTIIATLSPFYDVDFTAGNFPTAYFVGNLRNKSANDKKEQFVGHPATMRKLAAISPEFKTALLNSGLSEEELSLTQTEATGEESDDNL
jgi:hypothetical protein